MDDRVQVAVIGAGPAGLSAACRAAERGMSHVLLEASPHLANTIYLYQKGKFVMAEPGVLPLRSPLSFSASRREEVLENWALRSRELGIKLQLRAEVTAITPSTGGFAITLSHGQSIQADKVVFSIGLQGNLRKLGVAGEDLPFVQYQLNDPDEYSDEVIFVVGAGDAAIENALALAAQNKVTIVNRKDEFSRAKDANNQAILAAIDNPAIPLDCFYETTLEKVFEGNDDNSWPGTIVLNTPDGQASVGCDRIIARLGAIPPRKFVESCGITFPSDDPASVPEVSAQYESNVPGLYIIGALAGFPLIKQAMNQGYEVIEFIAGEKVEPADTPLLREKFTPLTQAHEENDNVDASLEFIRQQQPLLAELTTLQLREFMLDGTVHAPASGDVIFENKDYTNSMYFILDGSVYLNVHADDPTSMVTLAKGQFFGEMGLISGRRRTATVYAGKNCLLIEAPRRSMLKLMSSVAGVKRRIDEAFLIRAIQAHIAPGVAAEELHDLVATAQMQHFAADEVLFKEGEAGDCLHLIRSGSITVSRAIAGRDVVMAYVPAGNYVGEMALISDMPRSATAKAAVATETIRLDDASFRRLMQAQPFVREQVQKVYEARLAQEMNMAAHPESGNLLGFLMQQGLGEATDVLLIDESLCLRCDFCEKACAATHQNVSRLDREAGARFDQLHVPTSCRHCEHPHCMKDCPPDAIHRAPNGEVYIADTCIGCGNCEKNCPYGVIHMGVGSGKKPGVLPWLLTGLGMEPGSDYKPKPDEKDAKRAVKCDMCRDVSGGPACVRACPTGAAIRMSPDEFVDRVSNT
ncbi:MAG TPA: cyclic nucleotide-binding domain-containing protein [Gammaproteobacteria bacterium]|nr:cyclic nucleotide-binding domain-containing protein [Gammaproteobacteria bacterium]